MDYSIPLPRGATCLVSEEDADLAQLKWWLHEEGYALHSVWVPPHKHHIRMHRVILERMLGRTLQSSEHCDHRNGNRLDNRRENLRLATRQQNQRNQKTRADNTSGFKGVAWHKQFGKWRAYIVVGGHQRSLGLYPTREAAHAAYERAAADLFGEFKR